MAKVKFTTNIDEELLTEIKILALKEKRNVNEVIEEQLKNYLNKKQEEMKMKELRAWLEERYGTGGEVTINYNNEKVTGIMYGNDECFEMDDFYQYILTEDALYKAFYEIPEGNEDLGDLDYESPIDLKDADAEYYIEYVI